MTRSILISVIGLLVSGLIFAAPAMAQDEGNPSEKGEQARQQNAPQDTMKVVGPDETPEGVDRELRLPETASEQGKESSSEGLETANEAREKGRDFGRERAEQARQKGREKAQEARERARERAREAQEQKRGDEVRDRVQDRVQDRDVPRNNQ